MIFNENKLSFGRHQTFPLRYSWLTKGYQAFTEDNTIFRSDEATIVLGVGKNMVNAIHYWLQATQILENTNDGLKTTVIGEEIFGYNGFDVYLEDEATIWLIHWLLATNAKMATSWYWFFNYFHKPEFNSKELAEALELFVKQKTKSKIATGTLMKDINVLLKMYAPPHQYKPRFLEDVLDSPLSLLQLINQSSDKKNYYIYNGDRRNIPLGVIGYAVTSIFDQVEVNTIPIEDLVYMKANHPSIGSIFKLTENALLAKLEQLLNYIPNTLEIRETAGIHQLYRMKKIEPITYIKKHYDDSFIRGEYEHF